MLQAGANACALHAADHGGGQLAGQHRIFGEILEIAAAERIAFDVRAGAEQQAHAVGGRFFPESAADLLQQLRIPAAGAQNRRGKAGRRQRIVDIRFVDAIRHFPQAVGAVAHAEDRHSCVRYCLGVPVVGAGAQSDLILKAHAFDLIHIKTSPLSLKAARDDTLPRSDLSRSILNHPGSDNRAAYPP